SSPSVKKVITEITASHHHALAFGRRRSSKRTGGCQAVTGGLRCAPSRLGSAKSRRARRGRTDEEDHHPLDPHRRWGRRGQEGSRRLIRPEGEVWSGPATRGPVPRSQFGRDF